MDNKNELTNAYMWVNYGNHDLSYDANGNLTLLNIDYSAFVRSYYYDDENRLEG